MLEKDPEDILQYTVDWSQWLKPGEVITSAQMQGENSLSASDVTNTETEVQCWLAGGAPNVTYYPQCTITTNQGRVVQRSFPLWVRQK